MKLNIEGLKLAFAKDRRVILAVLFGSARDGNLRPGSDVDIGVLFDRPLTPLEFFDFYLTVTAELEDIPELDLVDLNHANTILAFEALRGRRLVVKDTDKVAEFASLTARQYEDDMLHAGIYTTAA